MAVRDVDKGYKALLERVFAAKNPVIQVGIFAADGAKPEGTSADGTTVLDVAIWNEFGTGGSVNPETGEINGIPARSFIRAWFDANEDKNREAVRRLMQAVVEGKYQPQQILDLLGQKWVSEIQRHMAAGIPPPNKQSTIEKKGSSTPLINTGQMRSSVTYSTKLADGEEKVKPSAG